jgi:2-keto-3-deoxy-L-rhamnonate aldolase RhmA
MSRHPLTEMACRLAAAKRGEATAVGFFLVTAEPMLAELFGVAGADFLVLDMEAAPIGKRDVMHCLQALTGSACTAVVRVPWLQHHLIEHALDAGAHAVLVPKVDTAAQAQAAAAACFYPPAGRRGINPVRASGYFTALPEYLAQANERTTCLVQIESAAAVAVADEIAAVPGVGGLFIGAGDLAAAYGHPGVVIAADMDAARERVLAACRRHGKLPGIFAYGLDLGRAYADEGFRFIAIGNEVKMLKDATVDALAAVRAAVPVEPAARTAAAFTMQ